MWSSFATSEGRVAAPRIVRHHARRSIDMAATQYNWMPPVYRPGGIRAMILLARTGGDTGNELLLEQHVHDDHRDDGD